MTEKKIILDDAALDDAQGGAKKPGGVRPMPTLIGDTSVDAVIDMNGKKIDTSRR
ncbi:MAG: hypothetical protein AAGJ28_04150 [Pseudomonadota bacterium]